MSIQRTDLLALTNLRNDGRRSHEIRRMRIQMAPLSSSNGSALVEMGLTIALATVQGPLECMRRSEELPDRAILSVTVKMVPFAPATDRRYTNPQTDRTLVESAHWIQRTLEAALLLKLYPRSRLKLVICILADDGGRWCAALNAATLALLDAGIPMKDFVCACSAGYSATNLTNTNHTILVDLNRREEGSAHSSSVVLPCVLLPQRGTLAFVQCEARLPDYAALERVLEIAMEGCRAVFGMMQTAVREHASRQMRARNGLATIVVATGP